MKLLNYIRGIRAKHIFNAENCRAKMQQVKDQKLESKIGEITDRIKFVTSYSTGETAVIFRVDDETDYNYIGQHFTNLGFIVVRKVIDELNEEYMLISWKP